MYHSATNDKSSIPAYLKTIVIRGFIEAKINIFYCSTALLKA
jgi:hypothetical protein